MGYNIEIKAVCHDPEHFLQRVKTLDGVISQGTENQKDIFFNVPNGHLKLRRISGSSAYLIPYMRPDQKGPKDSDYALLRADEPEIVEQLFTRILGVKNYVEKERRIFLYENVRIHIDTVAGLGNYIEFEAVVNHVDEVEENREKVTFLLAYFDITEKDLIPGAYVDLLS